LGNFAFEAWVSALFTALRDGVPDVLSTLGKISAALGNDPNFATTITNLISGKASKTGDTFSGPIAVSHATEAQIHVQKSGQATAYLFSNVVDWGLYSAGSGDYLVRFNRATGKSYFAGIDSAEIVRNNSGTYDINISGGAANVGGWTAANLRAWENLTGKPAGADRAANYTYHSGSPQWLHGTNDADPNNDYLYSPGGLSVGNADTVDGYHAADLLKKNEINFSAVANGFLVFPPDASGKRCIWQWGTYSPGGSGIFTVNLPTTFPNAGLYVNGSWGGASAMPVGMDDSSCSAAFINAGQISLTIDNGAPTRFFAIGF
jgi:hypothetical protein